MCDDNSRDLNAVLETYSEVFDINMGTLKDTFVHIKLKENSKPRYCKARPVPYALKSHVGIELTDW